MLGYNARPQGRAEADTPLLGKKLYRGTSGPASVAGKPQPGIGGPAPLARNMAGEGGEAPLWNSAWKKGYEHLRRMLVSIS